MALRIDEPFQGPLGVALSTTNTSATGFGGTGTAVFDATPVADGTTSAQFTGAASYRLAQWTLPSQTVGYFSVYFTPQAIPAANLIFLRVGGTATASAFTGNIQSTGKVKLGNNAGTIIQSVTTDSVVLNELNRIDVAFNAGTVTMDFYPGNAQASSPVGTATAGNSKTGTTTATSYAYRAVGLGTSTTLVLNIDAFREDDTALPGPVGGAPTIAVGAADLGAAGGLTVGGTSLGAAVGAALGSPAQLVAGAVRGATGQVALTAPGSFTATATVVPGTVTYLAAGAFGVAGSLNAGSSRATFPAVAMLVPGQLAASATTTVGSSTYVASAAFGAPSRLVVAAGRVTAAAASLLGPGQLTATASGPATTSQVLYVRSGTTLIPVRLGMRTGTTVTYLSP